MDATIGLVSGLPSRRDTFAGALTGEGWTVVRLQGAAAAGPYDVIVVDLAETAPEDASKTVASWARYAPLLTVGPRRILPTLEATVQAGASDFSADPTPLELATRVRLLLGTKARKQRSLHRDRALVELAAAAGETLEPTTVLRAILGWIQRALPGTEAEIVLTSPVPGGRIRVIRPGPGSTLVFGQAALQSRPDLQRALAGEKLIHLREEKDPALEPLAASILHEGFADLVALSLHRGEGASALVVRAKHPLEADELALIRAAGALSSRSLVHARSFEALEKERERLERAWADRYHELLEANQRLRRLAHQKEELLGICAHDLRLPVDALREHVRAIFETEATLPSGVRRHVEAIDSHGQRLEEILDDLLDLQGVETGRLELKPQTVDFGRLTKEVCDALKINAQQRSVSLDVRTPATGPVLRGDPSKLQEVVANLLGNALRFSPPGGIVEVAVESMARGGARLVVSDQGPGIPPETLASLLAGTPPPGPGNGPSLRGRARGLGLAIAREITLLHGGQLTGSSEIGKGSMFSVELPLEPVPVPVEKKARPSAPTERKVKLIPRVLVVEDDDDVRQLLVDLLEEDHEVLEASDGEEGLRKAREERPDVVLMDLYLPRLDGFAALEELKRDPETADLAVVFLSAEKGEATRVRGLDLGAEDFLVKPFSSAELKARIARALRSAKQQEHLRAMAQTDALTGLPNYRAFRARLDEELKRARRYQTPLAAVMVDMDNLKPINDRLGHAAGNRAIVALADAVVSQLRETDFAARYGGDEFVLLLPHTTASEALALAERLRRAIHRVDWEGGLPIRASLGVAAVVPSGGESNAEALIRAADSALYRAKNLGRDQVCLAGQGSLEVSEQR